MFKFDEKRLNYWTPRKQLEEKLKEKKKKKKKSKS